MVGFGRKCQKLGRKQGLVENRWFSLLKNTLKKPQTNILKLKISL